MEHEMETGTMEWFVRFCVLARHVKVPRKLNNTTDRMFSAVSCFSLPRAQKTVEILR